MAVHFKNVDRMSAALSAGDLDLNKQDDKSFVLEMIIHAADIGNPCRTEAIYARWTERAYSAHTPSSSGRRRRSAHLQTHGCAACAANCRRRVPLATPLATPPATPRVPPPPAQAS
jgi:hypothetical protein